VSGKNRASLARDETADGDLERADLHELAATIAENLLSPDEKLANRCKGDEHADRR
jgi:hypothetical protein